MYRRGRIQSDRSFRFAGNCSPERVFSAVLQKLDRSKFEVVIFAQDTPQAPAGEAMLAAADRVVLLPGYDGMASVGELTHPGGGGKLSLGVPNLHDSRKVIQAERVRRSRRGGVGV